MPASRFVIIGLGTFGGALAERLHENGFRVTGVDQNRALVERLAHVLYEPIVGDATQREALRALDLEHCSAVFISLGEDIARSLLATLHVKELGAPRIIVKGVTQEHGRILKHLGAERVVYPEIEAAEHLADRISRPNVVEFLSIDPNYNFEEIAVPDSFTGKTLRELDVRRRFQVWIVGVKDAMKGDLTMFPDGEFQIGVDQLMLVIGTHDNLAKLRQARRGAVLNVAIALRPLAAVARLAGRPGRVGRGGD